MEDDVAVRVAFMPCKDDVEPGVVVDVDNLGVAGCLEVKGRRRAVGVEDGKSRHLECPVSFAKEDAFGDVVCLVSCLVEGDEVHVAVIVDFAGNEGRRLRHIEGRRR